MGDSSDEAGHSRGDGNTRESLSIFNVDSIYNIGQDGMPASTSNTIETANVVNIDNASLYEIVCTTMKKIDDATTREKATHIGRKRANTQRTNAVPRKKGRNCEMYMGKLDNVADLKSSKPRRKERRNPKKRDRAMSSETDSSSRSESSR